MTAIDEVTIVGRDHLGIIAQVGDVRYYLTDCCRASATGVQVTEGNPAGVACRGCYRAIDPRLGGLPEQPNGANGAAALNALIVELLAKKQAGQALSRVRSSLPPGCTVKQLQPGLFLVTNGDPAADPWHLHALVFDEFRLTPKTEATGLMRRRADRPLPVGILHRGSGRAAGALTDYLPDRAFQVAQDIAHLQLPAAPA